MNPEGFSLKPPSDPESDLAYLLQHATPGDPEVLDVLQRRFAADLFRLASALETCEHPDQPASQAALAREAVSRTLVDATRHLERFWGQEGVREWLYKLLLERVLSRRSRRVLAKSVSQNWVSQNWVSQDWAAQKWSPEPEHSPDEVTFLLSLPPAPFTAALLHYGHGMRVGQIAAACACTPAQAHAALVFARRTLAPRMGFPLPGDCAGWAHDSTLPADRLQQRLDGLLQTDPYASAALQRHLEECPSCRAEAGLWPQLERRLETQVLARWPAPHPEALRTLTEETRVRLMEPDRPALVLPWKMLTWSGLFLGALLAVVFVFNRIGANDPPPLRLGDVPEFITATAQNLPGPTTFPTPITIPGERPNRLSTFAGPNVVWSGEPSISADGRFLAFSSLADFWTPGDINQTTDIFLYDLQAGQVERLANSTNSSHPVISGSGRYVAYMVYDQEQLPAGSGPISCLEYGPRSGRFTYCADLLLADQQTGEITRITRPVVEGVPLEALTSRPALSPDGQYLLFYSSAQELPGLDPEAPPSPCPSQNSQRNWGNVCSDLFIYEIESGAIDRLPVGRYQYIEERYAGLSHPASMSNGGRYIALTLSSEDIMGPRVPVDYPAEAFVYDLETSEFIPLDITSQTETYPDGNSSYAVISANGVYAAFVSYANNLVPGDNNGVPDVFVRSLLDGTIERVSVGPSGIEGDNPSGVFTFDREHIAERLSISGDGRYVAFVSAASNLSAEIGPGDVCFEVINGEACSVLYLHDRFTGETLPASPTGGTMTFHFPSLSTDGRWLAFMNSRTNCEGGYPYEICGDLLLYDVENRVNLSLTRQAALQRPDAIPPALLAALDISRDLGQAPYLLPPLDETATVVGSAHSDRILALDVSPDGDLLATAGDDERVMLWDAHTLEPLDMLDGYEGRITAVRFDADNSWLATASVDGTVRIWRVDELASNTPRRAMSILRFAGAGEIQSMDISPSSRWLAVASPTGLWFWERSGRQFELRQDLSIPENSFTAVAFSPLEGAGGQVLVAAALDDGTTLLYDFLNHDILARLGGHERMLNSLAFSPNGLFLATASRDSWVHLWQIHRDPTQPNPVYHTGFLHPDWAAAVAFSPDSSTLITTDYDRRIHYFDAATGAELQHLDAGESGTVLAVDTSPAGDRLYTGTLEGNLVVYESSSPASGVQFYSMTEDVRLEDQPDIDPGFGTLSPDAVMAFYPGLEELAAASTLEPGILETPPEGFRFVHAYHQTSPTEIITTNYERASELGATGMLVLRQGGLGSGLFTYPISPGTSVIEVGVNFDTPFGSGLPDRVPGELVVGEWRSVYTAASQYWAWEPGSPAMHLRWQLGEREFALDYYSLLDQVDQELNSRQLVETAGTLHAISELTARPPVEMPYITRSGDTCTRLAARFGVNAIDLVRINNAYGTDLIARGCEILDPGLLLYVPVTPDEVFTTDLDCDGTPERVLFLEDPDVGGMGILLQAQDPSGVYRDHSLVRVEDGSRQVMLSPLLNHIPEDCGALVSTRVITQALAAYEPPKQLLLRWDGSHLAKILDAPGELVSLEGSLVRGSLTARTISEQPEQDGACVLREARHVWQDGQMVEVDSSESPGACSEPPPDPLETGVYYTSANLDCTGAEERLYILPSPSGEAGELSGFTVQALEADGTYTEITRYLLEGTTTLYPQLILDGDGMLSSGLVPDSCQFMILLPTAPSSTPEAADTGEAQGEITRVLRWNGSEFEELLHIHGVLLGHASVARLQPAHFTIRDWRLDVTGQCSPYTVTYVWDGTTFTPPAGSSLPPVCTPPSP